MARSVRECCASWPRWQMIPGHPVPLSWSVRMTCGAFRVGDYRVVYAIEDDQLVVIVVRIAGRGKVYRDI